MKSKKQFFIEGNIGVGKSTFLRLIQDTFDCQMIFEPHEKWQDINGAGNLLDHFYADTKRWAYTFQSYAFITRVKEQDERAAKHPGETQIVERSVFSDRYCFAQLANQAGNMNDMEWQIYQQWFDWLISEHMEKPAGFIYLRTTPETCYSRIQKRDRTEESGVPVDYLKALHNKHEDWLIHKKGVANSLTDVPVLVLDCDIEFESDSVRQADLVRQIVETFGLPLKKPASAKPSNSHNRVLGINA